MSDLSASYYPEEPTQIQVYPCPACHETISVEAAACRFCQLPIDPKTAQQLLVESQRVTTVVAHANTFRLSTRAAVLLIGHSLLTLYWESDLSEFTIAGSLVALGYGTNWLYRNRSLVTHDADYPAAIRKVKWTMVVWVATLLVQLTVYLIVNGLPPW